MLMRTQVATKPDGEPLLATQLNTVCRLSIDKLQRKYTHTDQCSPVTFTEAFSNNGLHSLINIQQCMCCTNYSDYGKALQRDYGEVLYPLKH